MRRPLLVAVLVALSWLVPGATAEAASLPGYCPDATGVTVVVDFQDLGGGVVVRCSTSGNDTGLAALEGAGFTVEGTARFGSAFVCRISGKPSAADEACVNTPPASAFWSYWHADDGGPWTRSNAGATGYVPRAGSFEGWSFSKGRTESTAPRPGVTPSRPAATPAPATTTPPTAGAPAPTASRGGVPTSGTRTTSTGSVDTGSATGPPPTGPARASSTTGPSAAVSGSASPTPAPPSSSGTGSPTATPGPDPTADPTGAVSFDLPDDQGDGGSGSPAGAIVSAALVAVVAGAAGAYALRRRRSP